MKFTKNVGKTDRTVRLAIAGVVVVGGILSGFPLLSLIGLVVLVTGYAGVCPVYSALKIDTSKGGDE